MNNVIANARQVNVPAYKTPSNKSSIILAKPSAVSLPCRAPTNTVLVGSNFCEVDLTKFESAIIQGMTSTYEFKMLLRNLKVFCFFFRFDVHTSFALIRLDDILK